MDNLSKKGLACLEDILFNAKQRHLNLYHYWLIKPFFDKTHYNDAWFGTMLY